MSEYNVLCFFIPNKTAKKAHGYWCMYEVMANSLKKVSKPTRFILITHRDARIPKGLSVDEVMYVDEIAPINHLHLLRVYGFLQYTSSSLFDADTISVDVDILFQKDPRKAFNQNYDVGLTYEWIEKGDYALKIGKINSGIKFFRPNNKSAVQSFCEAYYNSLLPIKDLPDIRFVHDGRHPTFKEWGGDEAAIMAMFPNKELASPNQIPKIIDYNGAKVRTFPSLLWNCQKEKIKNGERAMPFVKSAIVRHFCGSRKEKYFDYAARNLGIYLVEDRGVELGVRVALR